jgi:hypothetical protein
MFSKESPISASKTSKFQKFCIFHSKSDFCKNLLEQCRYDAKSEISS